MASQTPSASQGGCTADSSKEWFPASAWEPRTEGELTIQARSSLSPARPLVALIAEAECSVETLSLIDIADVLPGDPQNVKWPFLHLPILDQRVLDYACGIFLLHPVHIDDPLLRRFKRLRVIMRVGGTTGSIDLEAASNLGIAVCHLPVEFTAEIAETTMTHVMNFYRSDIALSDDLRAGVKVKSFVEARISRRFSIRAAGTVIGIVGLGRIGMAVAHRAKAFGLRVIYYDPHLPNDVQLTADFERVSSLQELLARSKCVTLHCPGSVENRYMINMKTLFIMRRDAYLINTADGRLVNEANLAYALKLNAIAGAALDVFEHEPFDLNTSPLKDAPNLVCTPGTAWYSDDGDRNLRRKAALDMRHVLLDINPFTLNTCVNKNLMSRHKAALQKHPGRSSDLPSDANDVVPAPRPSDTPATISPSLFSTIVSYAGIQPSTASQPSAPIGTATAATQAVYPTNWTTNVPFAIDANAVASPHRAFVSTAASENASSGTTTDMTRGSVPPAKTASQGAQLLGSQPSAGAAALPTGGWQCSGSAVTNGVTMQTAAHAAPKPATTMSLGFKSTVGSQQLVGFEPLAGDVYLPLPTSSNLLMMDASTCQTSNVNTSNTIWPLQMPTATTSSIQLQLQAAGAQPAASIADNSMGNAQLLGSSASNLLTIQTIANQLRVWPPTLWPAMPATTILPGLQSTPGLQPHMGTQAPTANVQIPAFVESNRPMMEVTPNVPLVTTASNTATPDTMQNPTASMEEQLISIVPEPEHVSSTSESTDETQLPTCDADDTLSMISATLNVVNSTTRNASYASLLETIEAALGPAMEELQKERLAAEGRFPARIEAAEMVDSTAPPPPRRRASYVIQAALLNKIAAITKKNARAATVDPNGCDRINAASPAPNQLAVTTPSKSQTRIRKPLAELQVRELRSISEHFKAN